jgi:adenylylsulfate kinase
VAHVTSTNITWHSSQVTRAERSQILGAKGCVVWLTGLSGSGKSTIACRVEHLQLMPARLPPARGEPVENDGR